MAQLSLLEIEPNEVERPFIDGDYVQGRNKDTNELVRGYVCQVGIKWLVLSEEPRCGWKQNGPGLDYGNLPTCGFISRASAQRLEPPNQHIQTELF